MVFMPPVETVEMTTDEDMNRLIASVRDSIARELRSANQQSTSRSDLNLSVYSCLVVKSLTARSRTSEFLRPSP